MFLLSDRLIRHYRTRQDLRFEIYDFSAECLRSTSYYFRLGPEIKYKVGDSYESLDMSTEGDEHPIKPGTPVRVRSLETFMLPLNVMALLGNHSAMPVEGGMMMAHGMSVDPGYFGPLEVTLINITQSDIMVHTGQKIGKIMFYDISDTGLKSSNLSEAGAARKTEQLSTSRNGAPPLEN